MQPVTAGLDKEADTAATTPLEEMGEDGIGQTEGVPPATTAAWLRARFKDEVRWSLVDKERGG